MTARRYLDSAQKIRHARIIVAARRRYAQELERLARFRWLR